MNTEWSLDEMYRGYDDEKFTADWDKLERLCDEFTRLAAELPEKEPAEGLRQVLLCLEELEATGNNLGIYANLQTSANTRDAKSASVLEKVMARYSETAGAEAAFGQYVASLPDLDGIIAADPLLTEYSYRLHNLQEDSKHLLTAHEEEIMAKMKLSGSNAWENQWSYLTSSLQVAYRGETVTLSAVRNLAYDPDPAVRKEAYKAELAGYERIKEPAAYCLNSIKLQMLNECALRGYSSPLEHSLHQAHMQHRTLDAMWSAIEEYLPKFWAYLRAKGKALGHENGLPWYDLFAPMGKNDKKYTPEQAREVILRLFGSFDDELRDMGQAAFDQAWIDFFPRDGKVGGAFCCFVPSLHQSRVLTNFDGSYSDIVTLAHELGHAFHNQNIDSHRPLNQDYSMPVAETASTFNENIVNHAALAAAESKQEKLAILESMLMDACQIICDIYSRYLFETAVFENRQSEFMNADRLCEMMLTAQKTAYGDGLDADTLHPYMWVCKSHYYISSLSFYNFPYAFGGLLARGLYAQYQREGAAFVPKYKQFLHATPVMDAEDAAKLAGIDLTDRRFWEQSLQSIADDIDEFLALLA